MPPGYQIATVDGGSYIRGWPWVVQLPGGTWVCVYPRGGRLYLKETANYRDWNVTEVNLVAQFAGTTIGSYSCGALTAVDDSTLIFIEGSNSYMIPHKITKTGGVWSWSTSASIGYGSELFVTVRMLYGNPMIAFHTANGANPNYYRITTEVLNPTTMSFPYSANDILQQPNGGHRAMKLQLTKDATLLCVNSNGTYSYQALAYPLGSNGGIAGGGGGPTGADIPTQGVGYDAVFTVADRPDVAKRLAMVGWKFSTQIRAFDLVSYTWNRQTSMDISISPINIDFTPNFPHPTSVILGADPYFTYIALLETGSNKFRVWRGSWGYPSDFTTFRWEGELPGVPYLTSEFGGNHPVGLFGVEHKGLNAVVGYKANGALYLMDLEDYFPRFTTTARRGFGVTMLGKSAKGIRSV